MTVLNAVKDNGTVTAWTSTVLRNVHFERCTAVPTKTADRSIQRTSVLMIWKGILDADGFRCVTRDQLAVLEDRSGAFCLENGDYIIPGVCEDLPEVGKPLREFIRTHDVLQITSVEPCLYGSFYLQHWEVKLE